MFQKVESFIYLEAAKLDNAQYEDWAEMYDENCKYWIPSWQTESQLVVEPSQELSLIYWNKQNINEYVQRLNSGDAHVMVPLPRSTRYITNIRIEQNNVNEFKVSSKWFLHDFRTGFNQGVQQFFGGDMEHHLISKGDSFLITYKKVIVNNDNIKRGHLMII
ncbi:aromatic-ring-hydroxylating dioxygenase subunit beta [Cytobacillus sp. FSL R5-0569]|uniref:aromatic-ring-hydroxylating dioxygenase subunit beta n=1 Tax=unclassified Cytobacillus TaxID=2675268 RepID=UPI0030FD1CB7